MREHYFISAFLAHQSGEDLGRRRAFRQMLENEGK